MRPDLSFVFVLALVASVAALVLPTLGDVVYQPLSDEGYYLHYMRQVSSEGPAALPELFREYLAEPRHWIFPTPSRVGFTFVTALLAKVFGARMETLSYLSVASHLALIVAAFLLVRRWLDSTRAVLVAALVAFSPLYLGLSRLPLTDAFISLCQVATIWLFLEYARDPSSRRYQIGFALVFCFTILTKEVSVLLALPFAAIAAVERTLRGRDVPVARTVLLLAAPGLASAIVWILAAGGPRTLVEVMRIVLTSPATNEYAIAYGSGGWYRYPIDQILMSPWTTALGLAGMAVFGWRWRRGEYEPLAIALSLVYVCQVAALSFFTQNLRYVAVLDVPLRVLAVLLLWELLGAGRAAFARAACAAIVAVLCAADYHGYSHLWLRYKLLDPVTFELARMRGLTPWE